MRFANRPMLGEIAMLAAYAYGSEHLGLDTLAA